MRLISYFINCHPAACPRDPDPSSIKQKNLDPAPAHGMTRRSIYLFIIAIISLTGCSNGQHEREVQQFIASVKAQSSPALPALPLVKEYPVPKYDITNLRSPFQPNATQGPTAHRPKEPLEKFSIDSLHLVGIITRDHQKWGLIAAPDGKLYQITKGQHLGQNSGQVIAVHDKHLDIVEMLEEGNHWTEHRTQLMLWAQSKTITNSN